MASSSSSLFSFPPTPQVGGTVSPKKSSPKPATLVNPLLAKQSVGDASHTSLRFPLGQLNNPNGESLRQRRKGEGSLASSKLPVPPRASLTTGGIGGDFSDALNDGRAVVNDRKDTQAAWGQSSSRKDFVDSLDRWIVVYGYATTAQYDAILHRFERFGKVTSHRGTCRPGVSNWIALQYESSLQAEKALCQQNSMIMDGVLVGVTRMHPSLMESLDWNETVSPTTMDTTEKQRLDDAFRDSVDQGKGNLLTERDVLMVRTDNVQFNARDTTRSNVCERFLSWWYGWGAS